MNPKTKRNTKLSIMAVGTATLCDLCGGQATGCVYDGIKNGTPVTIGTGSQAPIVQQIAALPVNVIALVQWGS